MKRTTKYVALDVHQATTVSSVRDETGRVIARTIIPTEAESLLAFVRVISTTPMTSPIGCAWVGSARFTTAVAITRDSRS